MEQFYLGCKALNVSPLCRGGMIFDGESEAALSQLIIHKVFEHNIDLFDTAVASNALLFEGFDSPDNLVINSNLANSLNQRNNIYPPDIEPPTAPMMWLGSKRAEWRLESLHMGQRITARTDPCAPTTSNTLLFLNLEIRCSSRQGELVQLPGSPAGHPSCTSSSPLTGQIPLATEESIDLRRVGSRYD